jgi:hypothetical protein
LNRVAASKRPSAGQHLLVDDGEAVLIGVTAYVARERFGRGIGGAQASVKGIGAGADVADQAKVADLHAATHEKEVAGLDVLVLELEVLGQ